MYNGPESDSSRGLGCITRQRHIDVGFQTTARGEEEFSPPRAKRWLKAYSCRPWLYAAADGFPRLYFYGTGGEGGARAPPSGHLFSPLSTFAFICGYIARVLALRLSLCLALRKHHRAKAVYEATIKSVYERTVLKLKKAGSSCNRQYSRRAGVSRMDKLTRNLGAFYMRESVLANPLEAHYILRYCNIIAEFSIVEVLF